MGSRVKSKEIKMEKDINGNIRLLWIKSRLIRILFYRFLFLSFISLHYALPKQKVKIDNIEK